jgi:hypothetical protein
VTPSEEFFERRRFKRYKVKPGAFAKTVSDTNVPNKIPINPIVIQRQGVQFSELTPEQTSLLDAFMLRYTTEEV